MTTLLDTRGRTCSASEILRQIGAGNRMAMGVRDCVDLGDGLMARVLGGRPMVKLIVKLNGADLYDVQVVRCNLRTGEATVLGEAHDVGCEQLGQTCYRLTHAEPRYEPAQTAPRAPASAQDGEGPPP